jgi:hypothetical protein
MRGTDEAGRRQGERWLRHLIFRGNGGRCSLCRARLSWENEEKARSSDRLSTATLNKPLYPQLLCRNCDERGMLTLQPIEEVIIHYPLTPEALSSW